MTNPLTKNPYCDRWSLPIPRIEDFVDRRGMKPFYFMVLALLESGTPLVLDAIVSRLLAAGVSEERANHRTLQKAWHGLAPVYRGGDGKFGLDLNSSEMDWIICVLELRPRRAPAPPEPSPRITMPDDVPLSREEVNAAVQDRGLGSVSTSKGLPGRTVSRNDVLRRSAADSRIRSGSRP